MQIFRERTPRRIRVQICRALKKYHHTGFFPQTQTLESSTKLMIVLCSVPTKTLCTGAADLVAEAVSADFPPSSPDACAAAEGVGGSDAPPPAPVSVADADVDAGPRALAANASAALSAGGGAWYNTHRNCASCSMRCKTAPRM
jgi:hypothetical protein